MPEIWFPNLGIEIAHLDRVAFTVFGRKRYLVRYFYRTGGGSGGADGNEGGKADGQSPICTLILSSMR